MAVEIKKQKPAEFYQTDFESLAEQLGVPVEQVSFEIVDEGISHKLVATPPKKQKAAKATETQPQE